MKQHATRFDQSNLKLQMSYQKKYTLKKWSTSTYSRRTALPVQTPWLLPFRTTVLA
jgi:hypothetical protein